MGLAPFISTQARPGRFVRLTVTDNLIDGPFNGGLTFYGNVGNTEIARNRIQNGYGWYMGLVFFTAMTQ